MKRVWFATAALLAIWAFAQSQARADTYDPLHFTCSNCGGDTGVFTPSNGTPTGMTVNETGTVGSLLGDFILKVLVPNNVSLSSDLVTGTLNGLAFSGNATLFTSVTQGTQWTSGSLEKDFLGFNTGQGSPPNPIGAFLPSTQGVDGGATGFFVLTLDLGNLTVPEQNKGPSPFLLDLANSTAGLWVLGDLISNNASVCGNSGTPCDITTAQSAALFVQPVAAVPIPNVGTGIAPFVMALMGMVWLRRRKEQGKKVPSLREMFRFSAFNVRPLGA